MSHWHTEVWIWICDIFVVLWYYLCSCGESCLLVSWCVGDRCDMAGSDEDLGRRRRPGAEDRGWSSPGRVLVGRMIRRSDDTVCGLHRAHGDEESGFLGWASKLRSTVSRFGAQNQQLRLDDLVLKITAMGFLVEPQNQTSGGFSVLASKSAAPVWWFGLQNHRINFLVWSSKPSGIWFVGYTTKQTPRSSSLLCLEAS
jgi:hypothetical protein